VLTPENQFEKELIHTFGGKQRTMAARIHTGQFAVSQAGYVRQFEYNADLIIVFDDQTVPPTTGTG